MQLSQLLRQMIIDEQTNNRTFIIAIEILLTLLEELDQIIEVEKK